MGDDQHGTAIIAGAGLLNALELVGKDVGEVKVVVCGVGAAGFTCAKYFESLGVRKENLVGVDVDGVVHTEREDLRADPASYLHEIAADPAAFGGARSVEEAVEGADVFFGLSAGGLMTPQMLATMARDPLLFCLANPTPEIMPELALATRPDVIVATGRSDFPNQINNVCAFPFLFRGALDCKARKINAEMKHATTKAIAALAKNPAEGGVFDTNSIIPSPFDRRLLYHIAPAVIRAAVETGVAREDVDIEQYTEELMEQVRAETAMEGQ